MAAASTLFETHAESMICPSQRIAIKCVADKTDHDNFKMVFAAGWLGFVSVVKRGGVPGGAAAALTVGRWEQHAQPTSRDSCSAGCTDATCDWYAWP
jgi:hypothetical protein